MSEADPNANANAEKPVQADLFPLPPTEGEGAGSLPLPPTEAEGAGSLPLPLAGEGRGEGARHSPFADHIPANRPTSTGQTGVHLKVSTIQSVIQLSTWPTGVDAWLAALTSALEVPVPQKTGDTQATSLGLAMRTGPEELMIVTDDAAQPPAHETVTRLRGFIDADIGSVLDLSHARCRVHIEGERCVDTLSKLFALDFREDAFPVGRVLLSSHHHVPCALHRRGSTGFDAYVFTTYAREMLETMADAALEYGLAVSE